MPGLPPTDTLRRSDYLLLTAFCALLFGVSLIGGRPLSRHEGVLPQSAREMSYDRDWVVPKSGGRPWLESPPLPQWITVGVTTIVGHPDREWSVRIAPALMGTLVVLLVGWMAAGWYGRTIGLLSGLVTATTSELVRYAWLAEDEIFLCALVTLAVALFVRLEFFGGLRADHEPYRFFGMRPRALLWFFIALGATNMAKGVLFGMVVTLVPMVAFFCWNRDLSRLRPYLWFWGWLAMLAVAIAWPATVLQRYPDAMQVWFYDQFGRVSGTYTDINEPWWYYAARLPEILAPWILVVPFGLWLTAREAFGVRYSAARFLWCWALAVPLVLSIPGGKHHHYLLHAVAPWSVLAAISLIWLRNKIMSWPAWTRNRWGAMPVMGVPGAIGIVLCGNHLGWPLFVSATLGCVWVAASVLISTGLWHSTPRVAAATLFAAVAAGWIAMHVVAGQYFDRYRFDTAFLKQIEHTIPADSTILVNAGMGQLEAFHTLFYLDPRAKSLHNLSFLASAEIDSDDVYVVTYSRHEEVLKLFGAVEPMLASEGTWRDGNYDERLTLFRVQLDAERPRHNPDVRISPMQAMNYAPGPYLCELPDWAKIR